MILDIFIVIYIIIYMYVHVKLKKKIEGIDLKESKEMFMKDFGETNGNDEIM